MEKNFKMKKILIILSLFIISCTEIKYIIIREVPKAQCPELTKEFFIENFNIDDTLEEILNKEASNLRSADTKIKELETRLKCVELFYKKFHKKEI